MLKSLAMYKCVCGKEFKTVQAYNGHKSHCLFNAKLSGKSVEKVLMEEAQRATTKRTGEKTLAKKEKTYQEKIQKQALELDT